MKKAVSILLCMILLALMLTAAANAEIINKEGLISTDQALTDFGGQVDTVRVYFKMPDIDSWYSDYSVYDGKYYASIYWWGTPYSPDEYPGYRMPIEDYDQGVYRADIPEEAPMGIFGNGFPFVYDAKDVSERTQQAVWTDDINLEGALEGDYDTLPEGSPQEWNFDGCIYVIDTELSRPAYDERVRYTGSWYIYYGDGCYGSYATDSGNFTSVAENCLNPDHFDANGDHIGGAHLKAPEAPDHAPADTALDGYYIVNSFEPQTVRSENKLYPSADGTYTKYWHISKNHSFRIVHYRDGVALSDTDCYPAAGWYNENGELNNYPSGGEYMLYFSPDGIGSSDSVDGYLKVAEQAPLPTEVCSPTESGAAAPYLYKKQFEDKYCYSDVSLTVYRELYYHRNDGEVDWALAAAEVNYASPMPYHAIIGNRVIEHGSYAEPFSSGYCVYDVKTGEFIDAAAATKKYDGFAAAFDENVREGRLIGDIDNDNAISVIDATIIQRCEARLRDYPADDTITVSDGEWGYPVKSYSDFDRDGVTDILDVTAIQRYLVNG